MTLLKALPTSPSMSVSKNFDIARLIELPIPRNTVVASFEASVSAPENPCLLQSSAFFELLLLKRDLRHKVGGVAVGEILLDAGGDRVAIRDPPPREGREIVLLAIQRLGSVCASCQSLTWRPGLMPMISPVLVRSMSSSEINPI